MSSLRAIFLVITLLKGTWGLRNVTLLLSPPIVERGKNVELSCKYDLQGAPLYSIKFYRGTHEFYRYSPFDNPTVKLFPFPGLQVDLSKSQDNSVLVRGAEYSLAGNISCEVSSEAPFSTEIATRCLSVVELPKRAPWIEAEVARQFEVGDSLRATCASAPARPAPSLSWFINDEPAMTVNTRWNQSGLLETRTVTLDTKVLPRHVTSGQLTLKCTALLADIYKETARLDLRLAVPGEPKHERVLFSGSSQSAIPSAAKLLTGLVVLYLR